LWEVFPAIVIKEQGMKNKLTERWKSDGLWKQKWETVMKCFLGENKFEKLDKSYYLENGYLDLRGFDFGQRVDFKEYSDKDYSELSLKSLGVIRGIDFVNVDFSYADFSGRSINNCKFNNCIFNYSNFRGILEQQCEFFNCNFYKGTFGGFLGCGESLYKNVIFDGVNMKDTWMNLPNFEDCIFENCKLKEVHFKGSHFRRVKFNGKVAEIVLQPKTEEPTSSIYYKSKYERWNAVNPMRIDFSEAELMDIRVWGECDFSNVILPADGNGYIVFNVAKAKKVIEEFRDNNQTSEKFFNRLLKFGFYCAPQGTKVKILGLGDISLYMEEITDEEERQLALDNWMRLRDELLSKNLMTNKSNATWNH